MLFSRRDGLTAGGARRLSNVLASPIALDVGPSRRRRRTRANRMAWRWFRNRNPFRTGLAVGGFAS
eukprot:3900825-Pyramimonas_sp.AAC.1